MEEAGILASDVPAARQPFWAQEECLIAFGCYNTLSYIGELPTRHLLLTVLEAGSLGSRHQQI